MREVIKEGRDVNEAIDLACAQLGVDRGQVNFEIIELPKTSLFGLRKKPAKVRVYLDEPEQPKKKPVPTAVKKDRPEQPPRPESKKEAKPQPPKPQPKMESKPAQPLQAEKQDKPVAARPAQAAEAPISAEKPAALPAAPADEKPQGEAAKFVPMEETEGKVRVACDYVKSVLVAMGVDAKITMAQNENGIVIRLSGDGLGVVIGRRGETLDALQYLTGLVTNRCEGDYLRVTIDTGNYREKRERTLQQLARKLSASALRSGRSSMLEPMNPYERRIIHATVSQIEGVTSSSIGEEPNRRVVISPVNAKPRPPRKGVPPRKGGNGRRRYGESSGEARERPPRRSAERSERPEPGERVTRTRETGQLTSTEVDRAYAKELEREPAFAKPEQPVRQDPLTRAKPKDEAGNLPLYGKIEL